MGGIRFFLEYLVNNKIDRNEEREQVCSLLLKSGRFQEINPTRLQQLVAKANFHSIYFDLAIQNKDYKECLMPIFYLGCVASVFMPYYFQCRTKACLI